MRRLHEAVEFDADRLTELRLLVEKGEGETLEFKRRATSPERLVREMVAFANTKGGTLLVGVGDDKSIPGLKYPDEESQAIAEALIKYSRPLLPVHETAIAVSDSRFVLQYDIAPNTGKLYRQRLEPSGFESYVRTRDQSIKASREVQEIIRRAGRGRGTHIRYGEAEQSLMAYLANHSALTLAEFRALARLNRFEAARRLVRLVLAGILSITPDEKGDRYSLIST
jgi:hypothetical protein